MTFPQDPLDVTVELELDGVWTDVTSYVYTRNPITITRGQPDEGTRTAPSTCTLTLNNRDGRFSPRNPMSPYYGVLGRNTPLRVSVPLGERRLYAPTDFADYMTTPDSAGLSITGDIDIRIDMDDPSWGAGRLVRKFGAAGNWSWVLDSSGGNLILFWSQDGTTFLSATSTVDVPITAGRLSVRATLDVDNGAGGRTVTFYTGPSVDGPWTVLGAPVVQAGTTSIFDSTAGVQTPTIGGTWTYAIKILDGIDGVERANPYFGALAPGTTSFTDAAGNVWSTVGAAAIVEPTTKTRFVGEVSNWPPRWDVSGKDVWTTVVASGITRRLGQGAAPLQSALRRGIPAEAGVVAYWPLEDEANSTLMASAVPGAPAMTVAGTPELASSDAFPGSKPLPVLNNASFTGLVPPTTTGTIHVRAVVALPAGGDIGGSPILRVVTTGTAARWDIKYETSFGGTISLTAYSNDGTVLLGPATTATSMNGREWVVELKLTTSGANVASQLVVLDIDTGTGAVLTPSTFAGSVGRASSVVVNAGGGLVNTVVGHVHARNSVAASIFNFDKYASGWVPETPGRRIERICSEEGVAFSARGELGPASGSPVEAYQGMGPQAAEEFLAIVEKAVQVDMGILIEPRDAVRLDYRPRETLYSQVPVLTLDYGVLSELEPVEDDQATRNDITVSRDGGSSARARLEIGPLSVQAPPDGIGIYDDQVGLNLDTDDRLEQQANWRLSLGTVDEARYPVITLGLERSAFVADPALTEAALTLDQGDLITISNPPAWLPPDDIEQLALGFTEVLEPYRYTIEVNCAPASPWRVVELDSDEFSRLDSDTTVTAEALDTTETGVDYTGDTWVTTATHPSEFPFDIVIGGERMTVTSATAGTFTVTRSVNGVVKSHDSGAPIHIARPVVLAL